MAKHGLPGRRAISKHYILERVTEPSSSRDWRRAAYEAEFETGRHEESVTAARSALVVRVARMSIGGILLLIGLILLVLPGPGLIVVAAGLAVLARDVPWASRLLVKVRERIPKNESGETPKWIIVVGVAAMLTAVSVSIAFFVW